MKRDAANAAVRPAGVTPLAEYAFATQERIRPTQREPTSVRPAYLPAP